MVFCHMCFSGIKYSMCLKRKGKFETTYLSSLEKRRRKASPARERSYRVRKYSA